MSLTQKQTAQIMSAYIEGIRCIDETRSVGATYTFKRPDLSKAKLEAFTEHCRTLLIDQLRQQQVFPLRTAMPFVKDDPLNGRFQVVFPKFVSSATVFDGLTEASAALDTKKASLKGVNAILETAAETTGHIRRVATERRHFIASLSIEGMDGHVRHAAKAAAPNMQAGTFDWHEASTLTTDIPMAANDADRAAAPGLIKRAVQRVLGR